MPKSTGVTNIGQDWSSGNMVYFEEAVGRSTSGDVLSIGTTAVAVGNTGNDIDFTVYTGASATFKVDCGNAAVELTATRIDCKSVTANTDGAFIKAGTSSSPIVKDTSNLKFVSLYFDNGATGGDNRGIYNRLYLTGAGGGGESLRSFTTVSNVAGSTAHGAHLSLSFGTSGSITGLGVATRATLHVPNVVMSGGTYAAGQSEVYFDGTTARIAGTTVSSIHRFVADGVSGYTNDLPYVFEFVGLNSTQWETTFSDTPDRGLKIRVNGTAYWIACTQATT